MKNAQNKPFDAAVFDLNGVLVDTDVYDYKAWHVTAARYGLDLTREMHTHLRGLSRTDSLEVVLKETGAELSPDQKEALSEEKNAMYQELLYEMSPANLTEEVRSTLEELHQRGYKLAVGSSSQNGTFILNQIGLGDFFDVICDGNDIRHAKPDPEVFLLAAQRLGLSPERCLVVEDALAGTEAAHRGGMQAACLADASRAGAGEFNMETFSDLLKILP